MTTAKSSKESRDIGALLTHIREHMKDEIDSDRIAVMGGSCRNSTLC